VACLDDAAQPAPLWALPIEFQTKPDAEMFGRLLEYLGSVWRQKRPPERPGEHFQVAAILVNLTGEGHTARDYRLGDARTLLEPAEVNLATCDAAKVLAGMAAGEVALCVLPFIPLMHGGAEPGIIEQWLTIARAEPDQRKRGDYGGLALVFAELAGCRPAWKEALKEWNMQQSQQVLEWQAEAALQATLQTRRDDLRMLLEDRFGLLPEALRQRIDNTEDMELLRAAMRQVSKIQSADELQL
jgi:hypothetical protein